MQDLQGTQTEENLRIAFARESEANRRYLYFAQRADIEGQPEIAELFRSVADAETGHAFGLLDFLSEVADPVTGAPADSTEDHLRSAVLEETDDGTDLYPGFAAVARNEGFHEIADWMETLARAEQAQAERFAEGLRSIR